jgi:hypothetical protein
MTQICGICKNVPTMPVTTVCNDIFCHLCIKTYILINNQPNCPSCHESIKNDCDKINEIKHSYTTTDVNHIFLNLILSPFVRIANLLNNQNVAANGKLINTMRISVPGTRL